jgi:hypothetical protein
VAICKTLGYSLIREERSRLDGRGSQKAARANDGGTLGNDGWQLMASILCPMQQCRAIELATELSLEQAIHLACSLVGSRTHVTFVFSLNHGTPSS